MTLSPTQLRKGDTLTGADGKEWHPLLHTRITTDPRPCGGVGLNTGKRSDCVSFRVDSGGYMVVNVNRTFEVSR